MTKFPKDFEWGTATASYQIEGGFHEGGRTDSIWDRFTRIPGNIADGTTGDVACDFYHRYEEDLELAGKAGIQVYRFSISWSRVLPNGTGEVNREGIDFYKKVIDKIHENGMKAAVTMYHWDLPQCLQDRGGWTNHDIVDWFREYVNVLYKELGDSVDYWITENEPFCTSILGYWTGEHAPGFHDYSMALLAVHHLMLAHGAAVQEYRKTGLKAEIGITLNVNRVYPATDAPEDIEAAKRLDMQSNALFCDPVFRGCYPKELFDYLSAQGVTVPEISEEDKGLLGNKIDFLGINMYETHYAVYDKTVWPYQAREVKTGRMVTDAGWQVTPEGMTEILEFVHENYHPEKIIVTENGAACNDWLEESGKVEDTNRIEFLRQYIKAVSRAIEKGIPVKGYYVWCFCDNFEWAYGLTRRFGIVYVDYKTLKRYPKESLHWYSKVIAANGIEE